MQEINIKIWLNALEDWSIEINGLRHEHISAQVMEDLLEASMIVAEKALTDAATRRPQ